VSAHRPCEAPRRPQVGICHFGGEAGRVVWMDGSISIYDGVRDGPMYSRVALDADLAAADLVIAAIRHPQAIASPDPGLNSALQHVHAAVHASTVPKQDWLYWLMVRLSEVPTLQQLNSRGKVRKAHRGPGVAKPSRKQFASTLFAGLTGSEITLLWRAHVNKQKRK
jgi:hypothetical protein